MSLSWLNLDLAAERNGIDLLMGPLGNLQPKNQWRYYGMGLNPGIENREREFTHSAVTVSGLTAVLRARTSAKNVSISAHASSPPSKPFQCRRMRPTSS